MNVNHIIEEVNEASNRQSGFRPQFRAEWKDHICFVADPRVPAGEVTNLSTDTSDFSAYRGYLAVLVQRSSHHNFPGYRLFPGTIIGDGKFVNNISPRVENQRQGNPVFDHSFSVLVTLLSYAEEWMKKEVAWSVDKYVQTKGSDTPINPGSLKAPGLQRLGKTARDRAKKGR